jgi:LPPG:FO 2-phospho-L-lactate transferase
VRTIVHTDEGALDFQDYFVRRQCLPRVRSIEYRGADRAAASPALQEALTRKDLAGVVICPSNPYLSIAPILALAGVRDALARAPAVVGVSPIVGGQAVKGPAAKMMRELGIEPSALEVARFYQGIVGTLLIDTADEQLAPSIRALGIDSAVDNTIMATEQERVQVARVCLQQLAA